MAQSTQLAPSAAQSARRIIDTKVFMSILNKRVTLKPDHIGQQVVLAVQGNGQFLPKGYQYADPSGAGMRENLFNRWIYNLRANSSLLMQDKANRQLLAEAIKAESAGDMETATTLFNDYLNAIQLSFNVIENPGTTAVKFSSGDQVKATVAEVTTARGTRSIVVNDVRLKPAVVLTAQTFDLSDLIDVDDEAGAE